jgi:glutaredoxin
LLAALPLSAAQLYRWVDDKGNVEWRDTPPPSNAKNVEKRNVGGNTVQTSTLPYSVQQAVKNFPVTLWAFDCGELCNKSRAHLARRGVPYTERNVQADSAAFKKLTGSLEAPVLFVGSKQLKGYVESDWDAALDIAGYPSTALPGYKPPPQPAAQSAEKPAAESKAPAAPPAR